MKKTILTIMVAAMMLVAFTACEQTTPNFIPKNVSAITIQQNEDFLVGEMFDPSRFSVYVEFTDGSAPQTVEGTDIVVATNSTDGRVSKTTEVSATYGYASNGSNVTTERLVKAYDVESVTLGNLPTAGVTDGSTTTIDTSEVTATVAYNNGATTRELSANEFKVVATTDVTYEEEDVTPSVEVFLFGNTTKTSADIEGKDNWTVDITVKAPVVGDVADIEVVYLRDGEEIDTPVASGATSGTSTQVYLGDQLTIQLWSVDASGNRVEQIPLTSEAIAVLNNGSLKENYSVEKTAQSVSFIFSYTDEDGNPAHTSAKTISIPACTTSYYVSVTNVAISETGAPKMKANYSSWAVGDFTAQITDSTGAVTTAFPASGLLTVVSGQTIPADATSYTVYVEIETGRPGEEVTKLVGVPVTVVK